MTRTRDWAAYLQHLDTMINRSIQFDMVRSNTSSDTHFEVLCLIR